MLNASSSHNFNLANGMRLGVEGLGTAWEASMLENSSADRPAVVRQKDRQNSRITNGSALLPGVDGRSPWVRRCKDVIAGHIADLGGVDNCSAAERSIIRRASVLTVELERLEAKFATAGEASTEDLDLYQRTAGNLRRLLEAVGLERRARTIGGPTFGDLLRGDLVEQQRAEQP
jgi:hypothetical protein